MERYALIISVVGTFASVIAAVPAVLTFIYTKEMNRGNLRRRIAEKEQ